MPSLELTVKWATPLAAEAHVWAVLSTTSCADLACVPSRSSRAVAPVGATEAMVRFPEIHGGAYLGSAVLDRDRNFATTLFPGPGDGVTLPDRPVEVPATGTGAGELRIHLGG